MHETSYMALVGLEIHIQLSTNGKMFCSCPNRFGDEPNSNVCPVCLGLPGSLPVMNQRAYESAVLTGLALNCTIAPFTKWDRKSYYYPDLPKNYQISQYDLPLSYDGVLDISLADGSSKSIRIRRAHLEEDAGKNIHDQADYTGVDLNRAGVPLLEVVSEPDMNTVEQVMVYARTMQHLVRWLGVSEANMQQGHMRFEPNINLHINADGQMYKTPIVEVKNLNSFRSLERTVDYEIQRQLVAWRDDPENYSLEKLGKQNRGYDDAKGQTVFQREKEEAHDYRYFPDPDLLPVTPSAEWIEQLRASLPELPPVRYRRLLETYDLKDNDVDVLMVNRATADLYEQAVDAGGDPKTLCKYFVNDLARLANEKGCTIPDLPFTAQHLGQLSSMQDTGQINATIAATIISTFDGSMSPHDLAERDNLLQVSDTSALESLVDEVVVANPKAVADASQPGKKQKKAFGFLLGQVMQKSRGQANPKIVTELLTARLSDPHD